MTAITRRGALLGASAAVAVAAVPAVQGEPDPAIVVIDRHLALYSEAYPDFDQSPEEDWFKIEEQLKPITDRCNDLLCDVFRTPAESPDGVLAKARVVYRCVTFQKTNSRGPVEDMEPPNDGSENNFGALAPGQLVWSLLNDLERLAGGLPS